MIFVSFESLPKELGGLFRVELHAKGLCSYAVSEGVGTAVQESTSAVLLCLTDEASVQVNRCTGRETAGKYPEVVRASEPVYLRPKRGDVFGTNGWAGFVDFGVEAGGLIEDQRALTSLAVYLNEINVKAFVFQAGLECLPGNASDEAKRLTGNAERSQGTGDSNSLSA